MRLAFALVVIHSLAALPASAEVSRYGGFTHDTALPNVLVLEGEISRSTVGDFRAALAAHPVRVLILHSPGGRIHPSLDIALQIRQSDIATLIPPDIECASACAFLFVAGTRRQALGRLGVHRFTSEDTRRQSIAQIEGETQNTVARIISVLIDQGVAPVFFVRMFETPNSRMYWFTQDELINEGLVSGDAFAAELAAWSDLRGGRSDRAVAANAPGDPSTRMSSDVTSALPPVGAAVTIGPGFDCGTAGTPSETAICAEGRLALLDLAVTRRIERLSRAMSAMPAAQLRVEQLSWIMGRNTCGADRACIEAAYLARLDELGY